MREALLEILAEPATGDDLTLKVTKGRDGNIEEGMLTAKRSGREYPIVRGIPRFVEVDPYASNFGRQWNAFREVQLDSDNGAAYSIRRFDDETGWTREQLQDKWLLDAGCGAGRFAEVAAARGPNLVALDLSSAIDATAKTLSRFSNVNMVQASLLEPPFKRGVFDFCYCIGVIQHTPDPLRAIRELVATVKVGGEFTFTIYARQPWTKLYSKYLVRRFTVGMPQEKLLAGIEKVMPVLFPVTDVLFRLPVVGKVARFVLPVANYPERRGDLSRDQRYREAVLDTFDMLAPRYDNPLTWQETEGELRSAGAQSWTFRTHVPVVVNGRR